MIDLGTLGGNSAVPFAINDHDQVVGHSTTAVGEPHAFVWDNGVMRDLAPDRTNTRATRITNSGIIGGYEFMNPNSRILSWNGGVTSKLPYGGQGGATLVVLTEQDAVLGSESDDEHDYSFIWNGGVRQDLGGLPAYGGYNHYSWAKDMNDAGQVVGSSEVGEYKGLAISHAFVWEDGAIRDLGLLGDFPCEYPHEDQSCGNASATDINNHAAVAGWSTDSSRHLHAVVWANGTIQDLGDGWAMAINDAGDVLVSTGGVNDRSGNPTLWHGNTAFPLGSLGGRGTAVSALSESGAVIGASMTATGKAHAFLWERGRGMVDLGTGPAGTRREAVAVAINGRGDIIGYTATCYPSEWGGLVSLSCSFDGESHAILWRVKR